MINIHPMNLNLFCGFRKSISHEMSSRSNKEEVKIFICVSLLAVCYTPVSGHFVLTAALLEESTQSSRIVPLASLEGAAETWALQWRRSKSLSFRVATIVPPDAVCLLWLCATSLIVLSLSRPQLLLQASAEERVWWESLLPEAKLSP